MTAITEAPALTEDVIFTRVLLSPEPETQRGRRRGRSPHPFAILTTSSRPLSGESATFRGRGRHRSTSLMALSSLASALPSRNPSKTTEGRSTSPSSRKKHFRLMMPLERHRRRSQSPSRSRSTAAHAQQARPPRRRKDRTRSRGREHHGNTSFLGVEMKPPLRVDLVVHGKARGDGGK